VRTDSPFLADDLAELYERLYSRASRVVAMEDVFDGDTGQDVIGVRHDVDNVIEPAVAMAEWEAERGYRSTYFILHGNGQPDHYWYRKAELQAALDAIAGYGHEIGFHCNAIAEALRTGRDPLDIATEAVEELRGYGHKVTGVVAHGDPLCYAERFVNDELFTESSRPDYGAPDRILGSDVRLMPVPRADLGLTYDPNWLSRAEYLSDSGGRWSRSFDDVANWFPFSGQLHVLVHADWWAEAFAAQKVAA
jgi:hypothetical protein